MVLLLNSEKKWIEFVKSQENVKYFGKYHKITQFDIDHDSYCCLGDCLKPFRLGDLAVDDGGNLTHAGCFTNLIEHQTVEVPKEMLDNHHFK